ncbi:MAG TPA: papain-like cysteine protease family protein [Steroidobacteraceae bacterium]|nr:papain-like cysteine protease family protein [Steroidobacteraceae bacterium]
MGRVVYDVPVVVQAANPICWVACMAMVASERKQASVGVGAFANGFDPSFASIPNPAGIDYEKFKRLLKASGFTSTSSPDPARLDWDKATRLVTGDMDVIAEDIETLLRTKGPFILTHLCAGFPYGPKWGALTEGVHAVVITGCDSAINGGTCWMNNPWGDKDQPILTFYLIKAIKAWFPWASSCPNIAYWDPPK